MSPQSPHPEVAEMRLVLWGRAGSGRSTVRNTIFGREEIETGDICTDSDSQECQKRRTTVAGRQVALVDTPDWFSTDHPLEEVTHQLSVCAALAAPGPHAFLLCVALDQPAELELRALGPLEKAFGPHVVRDHTIVLFTHSDRLAESVEGEGEEGVETYIVTRRRDLVELVERCGDRFHILEKGGGAEGVEVAEHSIGELLEKVEEMVKEAGNTHFTSELFRQAEARVKERQEEIMRESRGEEEKGECDEEEWVKARGEAERSVGDLQLDTASLLRLACPSASPPSFLRSILETLAGWLKSVVKFLRGGPLVGGVVRVLVGGPLGGVVGATVGSVVTEVGKRKKEVKKQ